MARIRTIKPELPQSESIGAISRDARLLFILLFTIADDAGRFRAASRLLASLLYPYDPDAASLIDGWLDELSSKGMIRRYEVEGNSYGEVIKWLEHQKIDRPSPSRLPEYRESSSNTREDSRVLDADLGPSTSTKTLDHTHPQDAAGNKKYSFEAKTIRLSKENHDKWKLAFPNISLDAELWALDDWAGQQGKNWFPAVSGALAKRNREAHEAAKARRELAAMPQGQQYVEKRI